MIAEIMSDNPRISSVVLYDTKGGQPVAMTSDAVLGAICRYH
jgi:hypothetical protein